VGEARAEHVRRTGEDAFAELVVPAAGVRMLQWTGRAIRTECDTATIICYDRRLSGQSYGKRILSGSPPYPVQQRAGMRQKALIM
jgi:ATP-dependent DNA helicase DinG